MLTRLAELGALVGTLTLAPAAQATPFIIGGMSLSSVGVGAGLSPLVPVDASGTALTNYTGATGLDFTTTGAATPGVDGSFRVDGTSGDFNVLNGLAGDIKDSTEATTSVPEPVSLVLFGVGLIGLSTLRRRMR